MPNGLFYYDSWGVSSRVLMVVGNVELEYDLNQVTVVVMPNSRVVLDK